MNNHVRVGRTGHFYDQDDEFRPGADPERSRSPSHARRGTLYDQDLELPPTRPRVADRRSGSVREEARREEVLRQEEIRRRQEELQWRQSVPRSIRERPAAAARQKPEAAPRAKPAPSIKPVPDGIIPLQITSRPAEAELPRKKRRLGAGAGGLGGRQTTGQATAVLAAGTFASRLTGFLRVLAVGYVLGVNTLSDAFNYANGIPNIMYDLLLGGILSATLIPVFVSHMGDDDPRERSRSISAVLTVISVALIGVSLVLWVAAPWVIRFYLIMSPSSTGPAERELATTLLRYFAPQVFFLGTTVASTAILNAARRFTVAAISPVLNNLVAIAALLVTKAVAWRVLTARGASGDATLHAFTQDSKAVAVLGIGTTLGYVIQLVVQLPSMHRLGLRLRPVWDIHHPAVRQVIRLSSWLVGVVIANQLSLALVTILAGKTGGGLTAYQFSYQFFQLPYALVAVSVASAIMPNLAERWGKDRIGFEREFVRGLRVTLAVLIPMGLVYMVIARPFIQIAIHHGRVSDAGASLVTTTLIYFAAGLPGFSAFFLLMRAYQAMQEAREMFVIYVIENAMTLILAAPLSAALGVPGLALAWVGPYTIASVYAVYRLRGRVGALGGWLTIRALIRICIASAVTVVAALAVGLPFPSHGSDLVLVGRLIVQAGVGTAVYVALARHFRIRELEPVVGAVKRVLAR